MLLAAALAATAAAAPIIAHSAPETEAQQAQAGPGGEHWSDRQGGGPGRWMHGEGMGGWRGMMHHRMMHQDPQERCVDRLAWRAAMRAYTEAKLNLTPEQRPLWDKVQSAAQSEEQKERQLCTSLKPGTDSKGCKRRNLRSRLFTRP